MLCQSTQELIPQGMSGSCGNKVKTTNVNTHAAMDLKFGRKSEGAIAASSKRTADTLYNDLESVAMVIEGTSSETPVRQRTGITESKNIKTCATSQLLFR